MELEKAGEFLKAIEASTNVLKRWPGEDVRVIFHDDADGIASASIAKRCLEGLGYKVSLICLEKLYPQAVKKLHEAKGPINLYVDIASAHADFISDVNLGENLTIKLDHHDASFGRGPLVHNLNPELYGLSGERDASGSTVAYLFFKALTKEALSLAHLAVVGSAEIPGELRGLNRIPLQDALADNKVSIDRVRGRERYTILAYGRPLSHESLSSKLTALGSIGYYSGGPRLGVEACLKGFTKSVESLINELEDRRRRASSSLISRLRSEGLNETAHIQWLHAGDSFENMGVKVIGTFCSYLSHQRWINRGKYIVGFMNMSQEIPGLGRLEESLVKVSARAPDALASLIDKGHMPPLSKLLPEAARAVGGFGDGHSVAASGIIPKGGEGNFITRMEGLIKGLTVRLKPEKTLEAFFNP